MQNHQTTQDAQWVRTPPPGVVGKRGATWALVGMFALVGACRRVPDDEAHEPPPPAEPTRASTDNSSASPVVTAGIVQTKSTLPRVDLIKLAERDLTKSRPRPRLPARIRIVDPTSSRTAKDSVLATTGLTAAVKYHGASSLAYPQKSFAIEFRDKAGKERDVAVLDMPPEADFTLIACWLDRTCMRNAMAYDLGRRLGRWTPKLRWVELRVNGDYRGVYQLLEAIRASQNRLDLNRPTREAAGDITGDYVFRREQAGKAPSARELTYDWISPTRDAGGYRHIFTYHYPRHDDLSEEQRTYLHTYVAGFEAKMYAAERNWAAVTELIDVESWVDYALVTEYAHEMDGWMKSVYFIKPSDAKDSRLRMTPLWDYNLAFGQDKHRSADRTDAWQHQVANKHRLGCSPSLPTPTGCEKCRRGPRCGNLPMIPQWATQLFAAPQFQAALACRWQELRADVLADATVQARLRRWYEQLAPAMRKHYRRWPELVQPGRVRRPVPRDESLAAASPLADLVSPETSAARKLFAEEVAWLAEWTRLRSAWLDEQLADCPSPR